MFKIAFVFISLIGFLFALCSQGSGKETNPQVLMKTSKGDILIEVYPDKAPITVKNFLAYVDDKFFDGTIFHRVIPDFMIQGGGLTEDMMEKPSNPPIQNEADNGLKNSRGTLAMARTNEPHSASSQFFINHVNNSFLNFKSKTMEGWGYCVFGKVIQGMDVVDAIAATPTKPGDVPRTTIKIISMQRQ